MKPFTRSRIPFHARNIRSIDGDLRPQFKQSEQSNQLTGIQKAGFPVARDPALDVYQRHRRITMEDQQFLVNQQLITEVLMKAALSSTQVKDGYDNLNPELRRDDVDQLKEYEQFRRAIAPYSTAWNSLGMFRSDFVKNNNDKMCRNAYVAIVEKAFLDYFGALDWDVIDKDTGDREDRAFDFLSQPNPMDSFSDVLIESTRDLFRYDAGAIIKTFNRKKELVELKAYPGTEFWFEIDRVPQIISVPQNDTMTSQINPYREVRDQLDKPDLMMQGWWSRGLTWRYWQRSQTGVYIPFTPGEVCYLARYKRTDSPYGTDYLKFLSYQIQYLIDSTLAAGKTFQNGLVASMAISHPQVYDIQQIQQRITQMRVDNTGPQAFGRPMHLVNGETVQTLQQHLHDMEWLEGQKFVSQLIWGYFGFTPDEFTGGDSSRATAYVKRNITKSRLLYPMMRYFEDKINREILPHLKGYKSSWRFKFIRELELDDKQKMAQTGAIRMGTLSVALQQGIPIRVALKIADDERLNVQDIGELEQSRESFLMQQQQSEMGGMGGDEDTMGDGEAGRYGNGSEMYQPMNFGDYGQGGENTEQRFGNKEEVEYQKADPMNFDVQAMVPGMTFRKGGFLHEVTFANDKIVKAKVYVKSPADVPEGRSYKQGSRGSIYYLTTLKQQTPQGKKKRKGGGGGGEADEGGDENEHSAPTAPDLQGAEMQVKVTGNGVGVVAGIINGKLTVKKLGNKETETFIREVVACGDGGKDPKKFIGCLKTIAKQQDLKISS